MKTFNWKKAKKYTDIIYEKIEGPHGRMDGMATGGIVKIATNRLGVKNYFL